jgi:hypothetical protein
VYSGKGKSFNINNKNKKNNNIFTCKWAVTGGSARNGCTSKRNKYLPNFSREGYMRSMQWQLGMLGNTSDFAFRHREYKKNLCVGDRWQDIPDTDFLAAIWQREYVRQQYRHRTTTVCQTAVHKQYNYSMSDNSTHTEQIQYVREQYTQYKYVCQTAIYQQ